MKSYSFNRNDTETPVEDRTVIERETYYIKDASDKFVESHTEERKLTIAQLKSEHNSRLQQCAATSIQDSDDRADKVEAIKSDLGLTDTEVPALEKMSTKLTAEQKNLLGISKINNSRRKHNE